MFDRASIPEPAEPLASASHLTPGDVLTSASSSVASSGPFFPPARPADYFPASEGSTQAVVADMTDRASITPAPLLPESDDDVLPRPRKRARVIAGSALLVASALTVVLVGLGMRGEESAPRAATQTSAPREAETAVAPPAVMNAMPPTVGTDGPKSQSVAPALTSGANKFGKLSIAGSARYKQVYLDGKRLLGTGGRSFAVMCGSHAIAVEAKTNAKELDVPCGGELVISE